MTEDTIIRPGQRVRAYVNEEPCELVLTLETEEKGDEMTHWWRYSKPYYPLVPFDAQVRVESIAEDAHFRIPSKLRGFQGDQ